MTANTDTRLPAITPGQPADAAVATILLALFDAVEANLADALAGVDPESLHDFRVAVRRTRSLLKLTGDVLPHRLADRYAGRFRWLGDLTTPVRDLDVQLLAFDDLVAEAAEIEPGAAEAFRAYLRRRRAEYQRRLVRGLSGGRFATLRESWRHELAAVSDETTGSAAPPARELARDRTRKARRRVLKRARRITPESPPGDVHDLRKRAKELRYLLEAFGPVSGKRRVRKRIRALKRVQNTLGAFQDAQVQLASVQEYATASAADPAARSVADALAAVLNRRLNTARTELTERLTAYLGTGS